MLHLKRQRGATDHVTSPIVCLFAEGGGGLPALDKKKRRGLFLDDYFLQTVFLLLPFFKVDSVS